MNAYNALTKRLSVISESILDFYYNRASSPPGFLMLILIIRIAVLIITTINFGYILSKPDINPPALKNITAIILWFYFFFIIHLLVIAFIKPDKFENLKTQKLQILIDGSVIAYLYWTSAHFNKQPDPYIFLFYFLPLLVTARFFPFKTLMITTISIIAISVSTWLTTLSTDQLLSLEYWFSDLLPQLGFLVILTIFYLIYYRRRKMGERLETFALQLEDQLDHMWQGWFCVSQSFNITAMDAAIRQRHTMLEGEATCAQIFCLIEAPNYDHCNKCSIYKILQEENTIEESEVEFTDLNGSPYPAQITALSILNNRQQITGVSAWVRDLDERKLFLQKQRMFTESLERVIDQNRLEDRAHVQNLARRLEAISQASESALSTDLFRGADEIVRAMVLMLGCRIATVRQYHMDEETGMEGLLLSNSFGLDEIDIEKISFLDLTSSSLAVKAFKTGEDQYVEDFKNSGLSTFEIFWNGFDLRSMACFPLKAQGEVIGTFTLFRNRIQGFSESDLQLGRALSNIMATLVANQRQLAREQKDSERRSRELDILSVLSHKLVTIKNPDELAQLIADIVRIELHAETSAVFIKQENQLLRHAISGLEKDWFKDEIYQVGMGLTGKVALQEPDQLFGKSMLENNVEDSGLVIPENLMRYSRKLRSGTVKHLLAVPLNGLEGTFGVLRVVNKLDSKGRLDKHGFSEQEAELMTTIACIVAVAMENAKSFEVEKKKHLLEQALRQSTRKLTSKLEEDEILATILAQLREVVNYDTASLFLWEKDGLRLKSMSGFSPKEQETLRNICLNPETNIPFRRMRENLLPILINNLSNEQILDPIAGTSRIQSWIGAPLIIKNQIIGWLSVDSWSLDKFTLEDMEVAQDFAQQAAIAIDNARQFQLQKEQVDLLIKLDQELVEITSSTDINLTMNRIARSASKLMNCEMAGVALYDKERKEIRAIPGIGSVGVPEEYVRQFVFPIDHSGGMVLKEKRVYHSNDASTDSQSIFGHRLIDPIGAKGVLAAPLLAGDFMVGVLYVACHTPRDWTNFELTFFSILSNHAAIALRNSELFDIKERRAELLDLLHNLSIAGQLTNKPEVIYNILLTAVTAEYGLRFNRALLMLYDKNNNSLKGFTGIGQMENSDAFHVWETLDDKSHSFESYIEDVLSNGIHQYTALHYKAKNLEIPIHVNTDDIFSRVFLRRKLEVINPSNEYGKLDEDFHRIFDVDPFVVAPLLVNNEVVGMLVADNKITGDPIDKLQLDLLESCASQAAAAIYRSNLHQQLEERVHVLENLQELTRVFSELAEPREVLHQIAEATTNVLHADIAYLAPYDQEKDELLVKEAVTAGAKTEFQHEGTFSTYGLTALAKQEPSGLVVIEDLKAKTNLRSRFAEQEDVHSVAVCRLELRRKIVGMLYVNYCRYHWFSEMELNTLRMLAGQAAVAIHNAQLLKQNESLAAQRERNRLREDLHDVLNTYAFKVMEPAESIFEKERGKDHQDLVLVNDAEELWRFSRHTYRQLERILEDMRDPVLVERGLPSALQLLVEQSKFPMDVLVINGDVRPSAEVELALYRICQEAISNIHKHAKLSKDYNNLCKIILDLFPNESRLFVQDFGAGFSPEIIGDRKKRMGLQAMENWARKVSAEITIASSPGKGTTLEVIVSRATKENAK